MRLEIEPLRADDVTLIAGELKPLADDVHEWIHDAIGEAELISDISARTRTGWPVRIVESRVGGTWRAHAFFVFFEHAGIAVLAASSLERLRACADALYTGGPVWTDEIVALAELWDA
jgi:hypothetical protein